MKYFKRIYLEITFFILGIGALIFLSVQWAVFNEIFMIKNVQINGAQYFDDISLDSYKNEIKDNHIIFFDLKTYKNQIESLAYVRDCKISRTFPETVNIVIYEREPLAIINSTDLIMLDVDGANIAINGLENGYLILE